MIGVRVNSFNDVSMGEQEQDANSALTELDKGLRSGKVGEQCEAIVRFPRLFEKYPFPILINSSFLKLADIFRIGNNFLRLWVLRVCQQSEKHLDKILNVDEFLRRVFSVLHSNDPVARALVLKTLGAVAGIIPERQNVHHAIRRGLDSHDDVEVDAAIYATTRFAAHSNTFAVAMCNKLSDMIESENTGTDRRDKLVRALRTVHGGAVRAQGVLKFLRSLMERFPTSSSVRAAISALTAIADDTVVHVPDQVELLLDIAVNDGRSSVRRAALIGLKKLADHAALWPASSLQALVLAASARPNDANHMLLCLQVMQRMVQCGGAGVAGGAALLRRMCAAASLAEPLRLAATAARVHTDIQLHCYEESMPVEGADLMLALESLVVATGQADGNDNTKPLRVALSCLVQLSNVEPAVYATRTATILASQLEMCEWISTRTSAPEKARLEAILEALGALGGGTYSPLAIQPAMPAVVTKLKRVAELACVDAVKMEVDYPTQSQADQSDGGTALVLLCTIACQERAAIGLSTKISDDWEEMVHAALNSANGWTKYRVARAALRYGHPGLAARILSQLAKLAPSESAQRWLCALHRAARADADLLKEGPGGVEKAAGAWQASGDAGGLSAACAGCTGCEACAGMGAAWCCARAAALSAVGRAAAAARALCTQPPPAVAHAHAQASREPAARAGAAAAALKRASKALANAAGRYAAIARGAFHADKATLRHLHIMQHTYNLLAQFLERITTSNYQEKQAIELSFATKELKPTSLEEKIMLSVCDKLDEISTKLFDDPGTKPGITHRHAEAVLAGVRACTVSAVWPRGGAVGARCRLSLSPAPPDHPALLPMPQHLALKLEGVVLPPHPQNRKKKDERQVKGVQLTVTATPHPRTNEKTVELTNIPPVLTAVQTVTPIRDFFSAQQLVSVPAAGLYTVAVEAAFVDQKGELWNAGPKSSIVIKAEDPNAKSNVQATRGRF